ncbi:MAG: hypothetical protein JZU50_05945 [Desulfobulbaceae bacterium]|nr:hypothetical protein [Desulfobulbaceae bacterium]
MNDIIACVFPETLPDEALLFPLVQVFGQLVYMQAAENEPLDQDLSTPLIETLLRHGRLQLHTPIPLGDQRQRFLALTGDIKNRRDDYASQLSMLSLAGLSRREPKETKNSILTELLQSGNIDRCQEEEELLLWQSRLMLKLGEFFDIEQADLDSALRKITNRQDALLVALREEEDTLFTPTTAQQATGLNTEAMLRHRLKAWSRLYFYGTMPVQPQVFITRHEAAFETLQEAFEKNYRQGPRLVTCLELPATDTAAATFSPQVPLVEQCAGLQTALTTLTNPDSSFNIQETGLTAPFTDCAAAWSQLVNNHYPAAKHDRCQLDLFLFPEISARQLFWESFTGSNPPVADKSQHSCRGTLVGLLKKARKA